MPAMPFNLGGAELVFILVIVLIVFGAGRLPDVLGQLGRGVRTFRDEGIAEERLREVHAPIGLDLGGRTPAEIALSILAELSAERYGGSARPLRLTEEIYDRAVAKQR